MVFSTHRECLRDQNARTRVHMLQPEQPLGIEALERRAACTEVCMHDMGIGVVEEGGRRR